MLSLLINFRGELAALGAALIWAITSVIYVNFGQQLSPLILNLVKGLIALTLLLLTLILRNELFPSVDFSVLGLLSLSGVVGIGLGDTAYFQALNCLGARRSLVLESLSPPLAALLALTFLKENLVIAAWFGIGLTIFGVVWVVVERSPDAVAPTKPFQGIGFGLLAALGQAVGAVLSRSALAGTAIDPLWSTFVRLLAGGLALLIWLLVQGRSLDEVKQLRDRRMGLILVGTAFASTYLAIWLQQMSLKYTATGISQALTATSPLFVIPIALLIGEKVSPRGVLGVLVALGGIWLLFSQ